MNNKTIYLISVISISVLLAFGLSNFVISMDREKISDCRDIGEVAKNEAYFECLEQNDLDTWDMNHEELVLKIWFGFYLIFFTIIIFFVTNIPYVIWDVARG